VNLQKSFSHPSLVIYFFAGTANWGTTNSKPPGPIIMMTQSETLSSSQILFITLFSTGWITHTIVILIRASPAELNM
jgi:hypothetical protein